MIDTGSGICLVSRQFVAKNHIPTVVWKGPTVNAADGNPVAITEACLLEISLLGVTLTGTCGVINLAYDALLGNDFLRETPFLLGV